jgi:hypothetical protein
MDITNSSVLCRTGIDYYSKKVSKSESKKVSKSFFYYIINLNVWLP